MSKTDNAAGNDPDRASRTNRGDGVTGDRVGTKQIDQYKSHTHNFEATSNVGGSSYSRVTRNPNPDCPMDSSSLTLAAGGNESRPKNINLLPCIKY